MDKIKEDKRIYTMAEEKPAKAVVKMGLPVTVGMLFMVAYNLVDTYFVGLLHNDYQLAATNLAYPIMMIMVAVAGIVGNGGASYIARCIGAKKMDEARHTLTIGFELILISSVIITIFGILFIDQLVMLLGAKDNTFFYTKEYVFIVLCGAFFSMGNYAIGQLLRSEGSTFYSMIGMVAGTVANIVLDPVFIFGFGLEIQGAAIATVIGNVISVVIYIFFYLKKKTMLTPDIKLMKFDLGIIKEILFVGIPHTLEQLFTTAAMIVNNNLASQYGELTVAAMGIANKIMSFGNYIYQGMAAGCQPLMGFNYGAKNITRMKQLVKSGIAVITLMELVIFVIFGVFAPSLIGIFSQTTEVISIGTKTLRAYIFILPFVGTTAIVRNTFNAMGKPFFAFGITIIRQVVLYIPFLLIFNALLQYDGLIHAQPTEEFLCMIISAAVLFFELNKMQKNIDIK